ASNNVIVSCNMDGTTPEGSFDTDNSSPTTFTWAASTPKQIQILIDPSANTARCFYSTGTGSAGDDWPAVSAAKSYTGAAITQWRVKTPSGTTGDCYVDQIKIYNAGLAWLGDSITSGHGLSAGGVPEWGPNPDDNSRSRADEDPDHFLNTQYMLLKTTPEWSLGRGVDADESDELDARVTNDIINPGSTGCVIWVGTNDIGHGTLTLAQSKTNITSIIDKLQAGGMASSEIILVEVAPCNGFDAADNTYKDSLNAWLSTEALAQGTRIASIHDLLEDGGSPDDLLAAYDAGDGLHLSTAGLKVVAQEVIDANLNLNISTAVDALTLTEYSASVQLATTVDTAVDALTLAEYSASIQLHLTLDVTTDALVLTEYPVKVSFNKNVYATTDALVLAEQLVNIKLNKNIDATVDAIILTENLVDITVGGGEIEINAGVDPLVLSVYPVDIKLNKNVEVTTHALLLTDQGAGVNAGRNVLAGYDTLVLTEYTTGSGVPIIVLVERREFIADNERREFIADTVRREFIS
ncbi:MAG: SGNH/GDSL hydrolase family protein, partial [Deltaproteobacteria bacterium]|nr:SGNH/GDSL hydrolase family protein [Deltaproteobacteria bacterium]